jgi:NodT family efflux transporter outer membrane factor (OMF) lipoprotein
MSHYAQRIASQLIPLILAGCSTLSKPLPDKTQVLPGSFVFNLPQKMSSAVQGCTSAASAGCAGATTQSWNGALNDPLLNELIDKAQLQNLTLARLLARVEEAEALAQVENALLLPQIISQAGVNVEKMLGKLPPREQGSLLVKRNSGTYNAGVKASWEVPLFGRAKSTKQTTEAAIAISKEDLESARLSVRADIAASYIELRAAQQRLRVISDIAKVQDRFADLTVLRRTNELASDFDVARAEQSAAQSYTFVPQAQDQVNQALLRLSVLLGQSKIDPRLKGYGALPALGSLPVEATTSKPANLLRLRPDIRRAEYSVLQETGQLGIAKADVYPSLTLEGALALTANLIAKPLVPGLNVMLTSTPTLTIPLFDWGRRLAAVDARYASLNAVIYDYRQTVLNAYAEAERSLSNYMQESVRVEAARLSAQKAKKALSYAHILEQQGLIDLTEQLLTQERLLSVEKERIESEQAMLIAYITLHRVFASPVKL